MTDISEFNEHGDEPGRIWKLTGPNSVHSPGGPPVPDYAALAAQAETEHRKANERYTAAVEDSQLAAFRELVFTAAADGITEVKLEPSDQGDYMSITSVTGGSDDLDMEEVLDQSAMDLPDTIHSYWAALPGVTYDSSKRRGDWAVIDIVVAAPAAFEAVHHKWLAEAPEGVTLPST